MKRVLLAIIIQALTAFPSAAQIFNRMGVDESTFLRYAAGRLQPYDLSNLALADSLYKVGLDTGNDKVRLLALNLQIPALFAQGNTARMTQTVAEAKTIAGPHASCKDFLYQTVTDYCHHMILSGHASEAMIEAREMYRKASATDDQYGLMCSCKVIGGVHMFRSNPRQALRYLEKAVGFASKAGVDQELPSIYIQMAQEHIKLGDFATAQLYCDRAAQFQEFFPSLKVQTALTMAWISYEKGDLEALSEYYHKLQSNPLYKLQVDSHRRKELEVVWKKAQGRLAEAAASADDLETSLDSFEQAHVVYAQTGDYRKAYNSLLDLVAMKDSSYIKVQNEDMAVLDAEMNNAQLREDAQRLSFQNRTIVLVSFFCLVLLAVCALLISRSVIHSNLEALRRKNKEMRNARQEYIHALETMEMQNAMRVKLIQNTVINHYNI